MNIINQPNVNMRRHIRFDSISTHEETVPLLLGDQVYSFIIVGAISNSIDGAPAG